MPTSLCVKRNLSYCLLNEDTFLHSIAFNPASANGRAGITGGQGNSEVIINFGSTSGYVKVTVKNSCGTSPQGSKYVTVNAMPLSKSNAVANKSVSINEDFKVYPNPVQDMATVVFNSAKQNTKYQIRVTDIMGRILFAKSGITLPEKILSNLMSANMQTIFTWLH